MLLSMENEILEKKIVELDCRPSDAVALAVLENAPIYVANKVWEEVKDMSGALHELPTQQALDAEEDEDESEEDEDDDVPF
jgi:bifunctional DNase/RNase